MAGETSKRPVWMIAAWPGMANVAVLAGGYLVQKLGLKPILELSAEGHFDVAQVEVKQGVVVPPRVPRSMFCRGEAKGVEGMNEVIVFLGEAQPTVGMYAFANDLLDRAQAMGATRVVTFASMASQLHPSQQPRVFGAATSAELVDELRRLEVIPLEEGQIGGLNGVLLGACAARNLSGLCLMGEIPYFAAGVPNPKAAKAVLDAFALLTRIDIDLEEMGRHAEQMDKVLIELLERLQQQAAEQGEGGEGEEEESFEVRAESSAEPAPPPPPTPEEPAIDPAAAARIEKLFKDATKDRGKAVVLKRELDKLGVFKRFENRFLDLFRRAE